MAKTKEDDFETAEAENEWSDDDLEDDVDSELSDDLDTGDDDDDESDDDDSGDSEEGEALDQLEAEELEMLTEDEAAESLPVDEAEELREIRRAALALESSAETAGAGEFVCNSCFLVKSTAQLADKRKKLCRDCA